MSRSITPFSYDNAYSDVDYAESNYVTDETGSIGVKLVHSAGTLLLSKAFKFPQWEFEFVQAFSETAAKFPAYHIPVISQAPFKAVFPWMTDAELSGLRTWMFSTLPAFDSFDMILLGSGTTLRVRFGSRTLNVTQLRKGFNEVTVSFIRV